MYLSQMPDKYDSYTEPTSAFYETDITKKLVRKCRKKIKDLHQIFENDKGA